MTQLQETDMFTPDEVKRILGVLPNIALPEAMFVKTLYYTGARISEIVGNARDSNVVGRIPDPMTPKNIDLERGVIILRNLKNRLFRKECSVCHTLLKSTQHTCFCGSREIVKTPRGKRWKNVEVPSYFLEELKEYIKIEEIGIDDPVFPFDRFKGYRIVSNVCRLAGIKNLGLKNPHPHNFRHTYVMTGLKETKDFKYIQNPTGHASLATMGGYIELMEKEDKKNIQKMFRGDKKDG